MTKQTKPRYRLERRGETSYVGLWEGRHCLCAICTKTPRGVLDAQLILLVMNSHTDLLTACKAMSRRVAMHHANHREICKLGKECPDRKALQLGEAAIEATKPKPKPEQESTL